jgi:hypothetical protein
VTCEPTVLFWVVLKAWEDMNEAVSGLQAAQAGGDPAAVESKTTSSQLAGAGQPQTASASLPVDLLPLLAAAAAAGGTSTQQAAVNGSTPATGQGAGVDDARQEPEAGQLPFAPCSTPSIAAALAASLPPGRMVRGARTPASSKTGGQQAGSWQTWVRLAHAGGSTLVFVCHWTQHAFTFPNG